MKNEGVGYRRDLCERLGIDAPESMYDLDERAQRKKDAAAAARVTLARGEEKTQGGAGREE